MRLAPFFVATAIAATASAAEVALRPDGGIEIRDGTRVLAAPALDTPPVRRGTPAVREATVDGHRLVELRVPVRGTPAEEVWIAEIAVKGPRAIWKGLAGPRDADAEIALDVTLTDAGVLEFQRSAQVSRCDSEAARLFPRLWDFGSGRFRPVVSPLPAPATRKLTAHRGDPDAPAGRPIGGFRWVAASTTAGAGADARALAAPDGLDDGKPETAWTEGLGGDGRGEFLTARASAAGYKVRGLRILPGDASSPAAYKAKNRPRRLLLSLGPAPEQRFDVALDPDPGADAARYRDPYWVALPAPVESACVTLTILEVSPGSESAPPRRFGTTAISDADVFTDLDGPEGASRLVAEIAAGTGCSARVPLLVGLGEAAMLPAAQALVGARGPGRECLLEALALLAPAPRGAILTDALVASLHGATPAAETIVRTVLARSPDPPIAALARILASATADGDDRARAARVLAAIDRPEAARALLAQVGRGPEAVRGVVLEAAATAPAVRADAVLAEARAAAAEGTGRRGDLLRALAAAVRRNGPGDAAPAILGVAREGLASPDWEVRARALSVLGAFKNEAALADIDSVRRRSDDPVLRHLAARDIGLMPGPAAADALRAALDDADPRVRETAAHGLGVQRDPGAEALLIKAAKQEPWPFVRRAEIEALGRLCGAAGGDLLVRASRRGLDADEVRRAALVGLARCRHPQARPILLRTLGRRNENATLRELSASLLGELGDRAAAAEMAAAVGRVAVESQADMALEGVTTAAVRALAHLGGPHAVTAAVAMAGDTRPALVQAAYEALGVLCDPGAGAAALTKGASNPNPSLAAAALASQRRCAGR